MCGAFVNFNIGDRHEGFELAYPRSNMRGFVSHRGSSRGGGFRRAEARRLSQDFAGELFDPGQPLDASKYYIILPDALGAGRSAKPSDGLRTKFPLYNYDDMVAAQYRLVTEGLGLRHLRLVLGVSMGGMHAWN
jgi:homoserine acetyltransferase